MPNEAGLNPNKIENGLKELATLGEGGVQELSWDNFCDVIHDYASDMIYPPPIGVPIGIIAMKKQLSSITFLTGTIVPVLLPIAFQTLVWPIALGAPMGLSLAFPTQPPPGAPAIASLLAQPNELDYYASEMARQIDNWIRKGQYDAFGIPPGANPGVPGVVPWM